MPSINAVKNVSVMDKTIKMLLQNQAMMQQIINRMDAINDKMDVVMIKIELMTRPKPKKNEQN